MRNKQKYAVKLSGKNKPIKKIKNGDESKGRPWRRSDGRRRGECRSACSSRLSPSAPGSSRTAAPSPPPVTTPSSSPAGRRTDSCSAVRPLDPIAVPIGRRPAIGSGDDGVGEECETCGKRRRDGKQRVAFVQNGEF
jgi:hypothetical protein